MQKKYLFLISYLLLSMGLKSQDSQIINPNTNLSEIRKYNNQIELDIKNLFTGFEGASLLYKRKLETGKLIAVNEIKLLRLMAELTTVIRFGNNDLPTVTGDTSFVFIQDRLNFRLGVGFEKQKKNKNFVHYYGMDAIFGYSKREYYVPISFGVSVPRIVKFMRVGVNPFFGIKYYVTKRISLGIETGIELSYLHLIESSIPENREVSNSNGFFAQLNNLRFITLGYVF